MELIILFVLFMILSSVVRALGGQGRSRKRTGETRLPRPAASRFPRAEEEGFAQDMQETARPISKPVARERRLPAGGITGAEDPAAYLYPGRQSPEQIEDFDKNRRRKGEVRPDLEARDDRGRPGKRPTAKKRTRPRAESVSDPRQGLAKLLNSPDITLGVVVSEVLSAPRAYRPHRKGRR